MRQTTTAAIASPAATLDPEVVEFRSQFGETSPLDELVRQRARRKRPLVIHLQLALAVAASWWTSASSGLTTEGLVDGRDAESVSGLRRAAVVVVEPIHCHCG